MARIMPAEITAQKAGLQRPDASWFRGESIDYINRLLNNSGARIYEFFNPDYVQGVLEQHCSGRSNRRLLIWSFLSFEWWCRTFLAEGSLAIGDASSLSPLREAHALVWTKVHPT